MVETVEHISDGISEFKYVFMKNKKSNERTNEEAMP